MQKHTIFSKHNLKDTQNAFSFLSVEEEMALSCAMKKIEAKLDREVLSRTGKERNMLQNDILFDPRLIYTWCAFTQDRDIDANLIYGQVGAEL